MDPYARTHVEQEKEKENEKEKEEDKKDSDTAEPDQIYDLREGTNKEDLEASGITLEVGQTIKLILKDNETGYGWQIDEDVGGTVFDLETKNANGINGQSYLAHSSGKFVFIKALEEGTANFEAEVVAHPLIVSYATTDKDLESCKIAITVTAATTTDPDADDADADDADAKDPERCKHEADDDTGKADADTCKTDPYTYNSHASDSKHTAHNTQAAPTRYG